MNLILMQLSLLKISYKELQIVKNRYLIRRNIRPFESFSINF